MLRPMLWWTVIIFNHVLTFCRSGWLTWAIFGQLWATITQLRCKSPKPMMLGRPGWPPNHLIAWSSQNILVSVPIPAGSDGFKTENVSNLARGSNLLSCLSGRWPVNMYISHTKKKTFFNFLKWKFALL